MALPSVLKKKIQEELVVSRRTRRTQTLLLSRSSRRFGESAIYAQLQLQLQLLRVDRILPFLASLLFVLLIFVGRQ